MADVFGDGAFGRFRMVPFLSGETPEPFAVRCMMLPRTCPSGSSASARLGPFAQAGPDRSSTSSMVKSLPSMLSLFTSSIGCSFVGFVWSSGM